MLAYRLLACAGLLLVISGCAMCSNCDDYAYPTYGGAWERLDPYYGRVGSAFTPEVGTRVLPDREPQIESPTDESNELPEPVNPSNGIEPNSSPNSLDPIEPDPSIMETPEGAPQPPGELQESADSSVLLGPIRTTR